MKLKVFILNFSIIITMISCNSYTVLLKHQSHSVSVRNEDNSHVVAHLLVEKASHHYKNKLIYSSFKSGKIYHTQGAINGTALQGNYKVNFESGSLKEEGNFYHGLKNGEWKTWYENGNLKSISHFHKGRQYGKTKEFQFDGKEIKKTKSKKTKKIKESKPKKEKVVKPDKIKKSKNIDSFEEKKTTNKISTFIESILHKKKVD